MTAVPHWEIVAPRDTDADLVRASLAGDRAAFGQMYDRYADRLHDFCIGMLRDCDGAADCVQDAFCIAATRLPQLKDPDKLRPWLYSIARNEALRRIRERHRETPSEELPDEMSNEPGPDTLAARTELADLISEAAGGLSDRDQTVLELAYRHGLDGPELAQALDVSQTNANTMVGRLRDTIERSLGALLVARGVQNNRARCAELATILDGWDGHFNVLMRKRIARHIESCPTCNDERRRLVSPVALLGGAPVFVPAPAQLRGATLDKIRLPVGTTDHDAGPPVRGRKGILGAVLLFAVVGVAGGLAYVAVHEQDIEIAPAEISETLPVPIPPPTATGSPSVQPGSGPPTKTASENVLAPSTTTVVPTPAATPPVDSKPPQDSEPIPEQIPVDPPAGDPIIPENGSDPTLNRNGPEAEADPTTERPPPGITGGPQGSQPPRRTSINSPLPGDNNNRGSDLGGGSTRRSIG